MKRTFTSLVLGIALLVGDGGVGLAQAQDWNAALEAAQRGDYATEFREWSSLASHGDRAAQYNLALMYYQGRGVTQDYTEAAKWYRLSAENGVGAAQINLGLLYAQGQGVTQDYVYAHMWFNIAASNGNSDAVHNRDIVAEQMAAAQIARAQELAKQCVAKHYKDC